MAINLLPEKLRNKEKEKIKTTYKIELTAPPREKPIEVTQKGGALAFFKTVFKKPKKLHPEEKYIPRKEERIEFRPSIQIKEKPSKPEIIFVKPEKPKRANLFLRFFNWVRNLFIGRPKIESVRKEEERVKIIHKKIPEKEEPRFYPKEYEVKVMPKILPKTVRPTELLVEKKPEEKKLLEAREELVKETKKIEPPPKIKKVPERIQEEKIKTHVGIWARFLHWLRNLIFKIKLFFHKEKKIKKVPPLPKPIYIKEMQEKERQEKVIEPIKITPSEIQIERPPIKEQIKPPPPPIREAPLPEYITYRGVRDIIEKKSAPEIKKIPQQVQSKEQKIKLTEPEQISEQKPFRLGVNLVPEEIIEKLVPKNRIANLVIWVVIALTLVGVAYMGISIYKTTTITKIEYLRIDISNVDSEISTYRDFQKEIINLKEKTDDVKIVLNKHVYWSKLFEYLEKYTISEVYYTSLAGDLNGIINLQAVGEDYNSVARQLLVFQEAQDFVDNATITSIKSNEIEEEILGEPDQTRTVINSVNFNISLGIKSGTLYKR